MHKSHFRSISVRSAGAAYLASISLVGVAIGSASAGGADPGLPPRQFPLPSASARTILVSQVKVVRPTEYSSSDLLETRVDDLATPVDDGLVTELKLTSTEADFLRYSLERDSPEYAGLVRHLDAGDVVVYFDNDLTTAEQFGTFLAGYIPKVTRQASAGAVVAEKKDEDQKIGDDLGADDVGLNTPSSLPASADLRWYFDPRGLTGASWRRSRRRSVRANCGQHLAMGKCSRSSVRSWDKWWYRSVAPLWMTR